MAGLKLFKKFLFCIASVSCRVGTVLNVANCVSSFGSSFRTAFKTIVIFRAEAYENYCRPILIEILL